MKTIIKDKRTGHIFLETDNEIIIEVTK